MNFINHTKPGSLDSGDAIECIAAGVQLTQRLLDTLDADMSVSDSSRKAFTVEAESLRAWQRAAHDLLEATEDEVLDETDDADTGSNNRLFAGVYSTGISYADRSRERDGDYIRLAFLCFDTLVLDIESDCPKELKQQIVDDAATIQARKGQHYPISSSGQTVLLGGRAK